MTATDGKKGLSFIIDHKDSRVARGCYKSQTEKGLPFSVWLCTDRIERGRIIAMEKMTKTEMEQLRILQAKQKRVARQEKELKSNVLERRPEILEWLGVSDTQEPCGTVTRLEEIVAVYGISSDELMDYISSERQVTYYRHNHPDR